LHTVDVSVTEEEQVKRLIGNKISQLRNDGHSLLEKSISLGIVQPGRYELSVVFCSDNYIRLLNNNWRNLNEPTDVLSFAQEDDTVSSLIVAKVWRTNFPVASWRYSYFDGNCL
jgi:ssRNA-specific RNase YbeY (16S rRNA maturation enzyme)